MKKFNDLVKQLREENPKLSYKEAQKEASKIWNSKDKKDSAKPKAAPTKEELAKPAAKESTEEPSFGDQLAELLEKHERPTKKEVIEFLHGYKLKGVIEDYDIEITDRTQGYCTAHIYVNGEKVGKRLITGEV